MSSKHRKKQEVILVRDLGAHKSWTMGNSGRTGSPSSDRKWLYFTGSYVTTAMETDWNLHQIHTGETSLCTELITE